ncbi:osomolarity two-component system, phosphorelay intermediate protein YPD1, partial [Phenoliferia sp. Uapishka_3]
MPSPTSPTATVAPIPATTTNGSPLKESTTLSPSSPALEIKEKKEEDVVSAVIVPEPASDQAADDLSIGAEPSGEVVDMEVFGQLLEIDYKSTREQKRAGKRVPAGRTTKADCLPHPLLSSLLIITSSPPSRPTCTLHPYPQDDDDEHEFSKTLAFDYISQADTTFEEIDEALVARDLDTLSRKGHFLKGSSAALGLQRVQRSCELMQHFGNRKDDKGEGPLLSVDAALKKCKALLARLRREQDEAKAWLVDYYKS